MTGDGGSQAVNWYLAVNGAQVGPVTEVEMKNKIASGEVNGQTLVWKNGMSAWQPAGETALKSYLSPPQATPATPVAPPPARQDNPGQVPAARMTATGRVKGKIRKPINVILLSIVTLGIYGIIWEYSTLEELRNYRGQGWSGTMFIIFLLLFGLPLIVLPWLIPSYVGQLYQEDGREAPISGWTGCWIFVPLVGGIVWLCKVQNRLNEFWASVS